MPKAGHQPQSAYGNRNAPLGYGNVATGHNPSAPGTPFRRPLETLDTNAYTVGGRAEGYGASGIKFGKQANGYAPRSGMNTGRPLAGMGF